MAEFTDERLVEYAVRNAGAGDMKRGSRWAHVRDLFCVGRTTAHELCERFGIDYDEQVGGPTICLECHVELDEQGGRCTNEECEYSEEA